MSIKEKFEHLARNAGGSFKTVSDRVNIANRLAVHLKENNIQIKDVEHLKSRYVQAFIKSRSENGIGKRTLQNEMSAIRVILVKAGRKEFAASEDLSNKKLGIDGASRAGTHTAMPEEKFNEVFNRLGEIDKGVQACAALERHLGLRSEEAVQSNKSVAEWAKQLSQGETIRVVYGTKGGRNRDVRPPDIDKAREAINNALQLVKSQGGNLVDRPDLQNAQERHSYAMRTAGAVGEYSPHALRYAFACDSIERYESQGFSHRDALAMTSQDLGHGDGRGRYIEQVYSRR